MKSGVRARDPVVLSQETKAVRKNAVCSFYFTMFCIRFTFNYTCLVQIISHAVYDMNKANLQNSWLSMFLASLTPREMLIGFK
jgi:hypothetical protein